MTLDYATFLLEGDHIAWPQAVGEPMSASADLLTTIEHLPSVTLVLGMVTTTTLDLAPAGTSFLCLNGAANTRKATAASGNRVIPAHLSAIPGLIASRRLRIDVVLIRARRTPDKRFLSLGVMVDYVHEMIDSARVVVAEIDERLPHTFGDTLVPCEKIHRFVEARLEEPLLRDPEPNAADIRLAEKVALCIPDGATVQFGVGGLPVAVASQLRNHRNLGLHSGVISDVAVDLMECGAVTNSEKGVDSGITVTGGLFGSRRLLDFANGNKAIVLRRAAYTHAASTMASLRNLHTINSAIAIDLSGQVNAEVASGRYLGAIGGQVDFVRGARLSPGGRSIIALSAATPDGKISKIVPDLCGQPVTTARSDIDLVVTEYGIADLWGLDLRARAKALISIAHPNFRETLERQIRDGITERKAAE